MPSLEMEEREGEGNRYQFSTYVYMHVFRYERDTSLRLNVDEVSRKTGIPKSTLYNYISGTSCPPIEVTKLIYEHYRHPLLKELLEPEGYELIPKGALHDRELLPTVDAHIIKAFQKLADLERIYKSAIEKGDVIDSREFIDIKNKKGEAVDAIHDIFCKIAEKTGKSLQAVK